ncbi:leukotoxin LktA family filamentous adhesin [Thioclava electrotropha]|uniref:Leukotoxin LktA family filamentous adhesin n=1 Tax=Thioclava electrotropha TaxID=1549850 RepID=A0ABX6YW55_9RHOB|nr:leukotoxin LktA family filamentous adhesin [Thioclava electrotropha]QPZ92089.1 leukotoxin LktA family filamentous adhesin [Thioclava electrotropha]
MNATFRRVVRRFGWLSSVSSAAIFAVLPAFADVVADGTTSTNVTTSGTTTNVTAGTIQNGTAFNTFSQFNVNAGTTVNVYQPVNTGALVNIVNGGQSAINGTLNAGLGAPGAAPVATGSNVFFVNSDGFVVSSTGTINAGQLTMSAPTPGFVNDLTNEAKGNFTASVDTPTAQLFAGSEPLSDGGQITVDGQINATRLALRSGGLGMMLNGRIKVEDPTSVDPVSVGVNTDGTPQAAGLVTQGGVIRLVSKGTLKTTASSDITAKRGTNLVGSQGGGVVLGQAKGDVTVDGKIDVSASGTTLGAGGTVFLFTEGSAAMGSSLDVKATSVAGDGGAFVLRAGGVTSPLQAAQGDLSARGSFDMSTSSATGKAGSVFLRGQNVSTTGQITTKGGDLVFAADKNVTLSHDISTRAGDAAYPLTGDPGAGTAGSILVAAQDINVESGTTLRADSTAADGGGLILLSARSFNTGIAWAINPDSESASITIDNADLKSGSIVVNSVATVSNTLGSTDQTVEEQQVDNLEGGTTEQQMTDQINNGLTVMSNLIQQGATTINSMIPLQVQLLDAQSHVKINNSKLTADGNWKNTAITPTALSSGTPSNNGQLGSTGLLEDTYSFLSTPQLNFNSSAQDVVDNITGSLIGGGAPYSLTLKLPSAWDPSSDALVVQSHAQTTYSISPKAYALGVVMANSNVESQVLLDGSSLTTKAGDIRLASTASEDHTVSIAASKVKDYAGALVVTTRELKNQLLVKGGSLTSAGALNAGAFTGKSHSITTGANAGTEGIGAVAISVDVSQSTTEAALGGTIKTGGALNLDAETLFFNKVHATTATMGVADPSKLIGKKRAANNPMVQAIPSAQGQLQGKPVDPNRPAHIGFGVAIDVQVDNDNTFATLGGDYHDFSNVDALTALGTTLVTATGQPVSVNSAYRFAGPTEGGSSLSRSVSAAFGKLNFAAQRALDKYNAKHPSSQITQDELMGKYSQALMLTGSVSTMSGKTQAEIGKDATVNAAAATVQSVTRFPHADPLGDIRDKWTQFVGQITDYTELPSDPSDPTQLTPPDAPGLIDTINPLNFITTDVKSKATAPMPKDGSRPVVPEDQQKLAIGITANVFNTDNTTDAVVRNGAVLNLSGDLNVLSRQESLFLHLANLPKSNPLKGDAEGAIGVGINIDRIGSEVSSVIESGAEVNAVTNGVNVDAYTRNIAGILSFSGGQGTKTAVNATVATNIAHAQTVARIGDDASITGGAVAISAKDESVEWAAAGAISASENLGVGASAGLNISGRKVWAGIGPADETSALSGTGNTVIDAESLAITAENATTDVVVGVAGSKVQGKPAQQDDPQSTGGTTNQDGSNEDDMIIPSWLFADDEDQAVNDQQNLQTPADSEGNQQKTGWAVTGVASLNLSLGNETVAALNTAGKIELGAELTQTAKNTALQIAGGGAVSAGLGKAQDTNALAGAFSVMVDTRELRSEVTGATINAGGAVTIGAEDHATVVNVAVGGAGTSRGDIALAGSVAVAVLDGGSTATVKDASITSDALSVNATDGSTTVSVGGAVGINMDKTKGSGVGIGIAVNTVTRSAGASITGASTIDTGAFGITADSTQSIYGFGVSAGKGKTGIAGSISVNNITGGARADVTGNGAGSDRMGISASSINVDVTEANTIFSLGGALANGDNAVGGAATVNVITSTSGATLTDAKVNGQGGTGGTGAITMVADGSSTISSIAVAGGVSDQQTAAGVGLSANNISATLEVSAAGTEALEAQSIALTATNSREINSLGGGAAASNGSAGGFASTLNLLTANTTSINLANANLSTIDTGAISATATATGTIRSAAVALSASRDTSLGGAVTVNVSTATTQISSLGATLDAGGALSLNADDTGTIESLAGGAVLSANGSGVGGAISANFIAHDTGVLTNGATLSGEGVTLGATNGSTLKSAAVGLTLTGAGPTAVAGSLAIGDIGNTTAVDATNTAIDAGTGAISLGATRTGQISILSGSAAGAGDATAVGVALSVASIHGGTTADLITSDAVTGDTLSVTAEDTAGIDAIAVSGAASGQAAVGGSVVYAQIGQPGTDGPSVDPLPGPASEDPVGGAQSEVASLRDNALTKLATSVADTTNAPDFDASQLALTLDADAVTRARVELSGAPPALPATTIDASTTGTIRSLAGAVAIGGSGAGVGAGIGVNLLFAKTEAELVLPTDAETQAPSLAVGATQTGTIETAAVSGGFSGGVGAAGSILVNVMNRQADAHIRGNGGSGTRAALRTDRGDVSVTTTQTGTIKALAGSAGIGGQAGAGGAIVVNVMSDDTEAAVEDAAILARKLDESATTNAPLSLAGTLTIDADQQMTLEALSAAVGGGGSGAFAGSFAVNVANGEVYAGLRRSEAQVGTMALAAHSTPSLTANAGSISASGGASVGLGIAINNSAQTVRADITSSTLRAGHNASLGAYQNTTFHGNAISGAGGTVGVTGSGVNNTAANTVEAVVQGGPISLVDATSGLAAPTRYGSDIATRGSLLIDAQSTTSITLLGGSDESKPADSTDARNEAPDVNLSISGGATAGVGVSASVNTIQNRVKARILDDARVVALGQEAIDWTDVGGTAQTTTGLAMNAQARSGISMLTANGSVGGVAGVSALFGMNLIDDEALVQLGSEQGSDLVRLNPRYDTDFSGDIGSDTAASAQDVTLNADTTNDSALYTVNVAAGGAAGVGASAGTTVVTSAAKVETYDAQVAAARGIAASATSKSTLTSFVAGIGGGFVGVSGNANVNVLNSTAEIGINGGSFDAGRDLSLNTLIDNDLYSMTGGGSGGAVAVGGAIQVTVADGTSKVSVGSGRAGSIARLDAGNDLTAKADTQLLQKGYAGAGAAGGAGVALSANLVVDRATTEVAVGDDQELTAGGKLSLTANETADLTGVAGSIGGGALGVGASLDFASLQGTTKVTVGDGAVLKANDASNGARGVGRDGITLSATSERTLNSTVVSIGAGAIAVGAAISVTDLGGAADDESGNLSKAMASINDELTSDQSGSGGLDSNATEQDRQNTGGSIIGFAGASDTQSQIVNARQHLNPDATGSDQVGVEIGSATLLTNGDLSLTSHAKTDLSQVAGAGAGSIFGGASSGIVVSNVSTGAAVTLQDGATLSAGGAVTLGAKTYGGDDGNVIDASASTVAASGGYTGGAGVTVATLNAGASVQMGAGVSVSGYSIGINSDRAGEVKTVTTNITGGLVGAVGVAVSSAKSEGTSAITIGRSGASLNNLKSSAGKISLETSDGTSAHAEGSGSSGGLAGSGNSVVVSGTNLGNSAVSVLRTTVNAGGAFDLQNTNGGAAFAEAHGISVAAGVSIGAGVATSRADMNVTTLFAANVTASDITINSEIKRTDGRMTSQAKAQSTSGGLLSGNGAAAHAYSSYGITSTLTGNLTATNAISLSADASAVKVDAFATGRSGGAVAVGVTLAYAGQDTANGDSGDVAFSINNAVLKGKVVTLGAGNAPDISAGADSGSGGLVSGSGAETHVTTDTKSTFDIGTAGTTVITATDRLQITSAQNATFASSVDTVSAAAVGYSGALSRNTIGAATALTLGGNTTIAARNIEIGADTTFKRPDNGYNLVSGSGGAIDVAAMRSFVTVNASTDLNISDGAMLLQSGVADGGQTFDLGASTNMVFLDRLKLDSGGAIASPNGNSTVDIQTNTAHVTIGSAKLLAMDDLDVYAGGDANIKSEVDTTSYGLSGAASGNTVATYNADNKISLTSGADLQSFTDIGLRAGYTSKGAQKVDVNAETRVFNKTAFPINGTPGADATANMNQRVSVGTGASVAAVHDVYVFAERGGGDVLGYGRGKDLYREVAAAIGSALSEAFGGDPVSLDIESGTSTDKGANMIEVNGYVRAGSRNKQILILDENNHLDNGSESYVNSQGQTVNYTNENADGILNDPSNPDPEIQAMITQGTVQNELASRIAELQAKIDDPILGKDTQAVTAWKAEIEALASRLDSTNTGTVDFINLPDIRASGGSIYMRADTVQGSSTGTLDAPGNAQIVVHVYSDAFVNAGSMEIPSSDGGRIYFNDVSVTTPDDVQRLANPKGTPIDYKMISGNDAGESKIELVTYGNGSITLNGAITNLDGSVLVNSNFGDLDVRADISAKTINLSAGGNFTQGYTPGLRNEGGEPRSIYAGYFNKVDNVVRDYLAGGFDVSGYDGGSMTASYGSSISLPTPSVPDFTIEPRQSSIKAGANVYITADQLNINGLIQAGVGSYDVTIDDGLLSDLSSFSTTQPTVLFNPSEPVNNNIVRKPYVSANDVWVKYDPTATNAEGVQTGAITISPMIVKGGTVEITGQILSTGAGRIESLDGFGNINVTNKTSLPVVFDRVDTGEAGANGQGLEGLVRITDTDPLKKTAAGNNLITEYRRIGQTLKVYDNSSTYDSVTKTYGEGADAVSVTRIVPTTLVNSSTVDSGRSASYQPVLNRDMVLLQSEIITQVTNYTQKTFYFWAPFSKDIKSKSDPAKVTKLDPDVVFGASGAYVTSENTSINGGDYSYGFTGERTSYSNVKGAVTTDDKRVLGIGDVYKTWSETSTANVLYKHRLRADYPIDIVFSGSDSGALNITSGGDVIFKKTVSNLVGDTNITSDNGSVVTASPQITATLGNLDISAENGRIGGVSGAFRVDQSEGSRLTAVGGSAVNIREMSGSMTIGNVEAKDRPANTDAAITGTVKLFADGDIKMADQSTGAVTATSVDLISLNGNIGSLDSAFAPVWVSLNGGVLDATANKDVVIGARSGDLPVHSVTAQTGSATLAAFNGSILDRNNIEVRDIRSESELAKLWTQDMGLDDTVAQDARAQQQLDALAASREHDYRAYWKARTDAGGGSISYTMDASDQTALLNSGWTQAQLDDYISQQQGLYAEWNNETVEQTSFTYTPTADDRAAVLQGIGWTTDELKHWIRAGLIKGTGDTNTRIEDPNINAYKDINLLASDTIGEMLDPYTVGAGNDLTQDLLVLSQAEPSDLTFTSDGKVVVRRAEDLNFAFTGLDTAGAPVGTLNADALGTDVFLGAETAAAIKEVNAAGDVTIKLDGTMSDAHSGNPAVTGRIIVLESGNTAPIATETNPLTVQVRTGGMLTARSGVEVNIAATGDLPLAEAYAPGPVRISATGAITDALATGAVRISAGSLKLTGSSIGTSAVALPFTLTDTANGGALDVTTTAGDAWLSATGDLPIASARIAGGGKITTDGLMSLTGTDTLGFGTGSTLELETALGLDTSASSGTDAKGGTLSLVTGGPVGSATRRFETALGTFNYTATGTDPTPLWMREADDLTIASLTQMTADSPTDITVGGALTIGTITSPDEVRLDAASFTEGRIVAKRTKLTASGTIGSVTPLSLTTGSLYAATVDGDIRLALSDRATDFEQVTAGGTGAIALTSVNAPLTLLSGPGITTQGGAIGLGVTSLVANADILSHDGAISIKSAGLLQQAAGTSIDAGTGTIGLDVAGNMVAAHVVTQSTADPALIVGVKGALSIASGQSGTVFEANAAGAGTVLTLGSMTPIGPNGLPVAFDHVTATVATGAMHLNERDAIRLDRLQTNDGLIDLYAGGPITVRDIAAGGASPIVISAGRGDIRSDGAQLAGGDLRLFAFNGAITGETGTAFMGDMSDGATGHFYADGDVTYTETAGDLRAGFALSQNGALKLDSASGQMALGVLGARTDLTLAADDALRVTILGGATVDLADEQTLQLIHPELYGQREAQAPNNADLRARNAGSSLYAGLLNVRDTLGLHADNIDAYLYDVTPADALALTLDGHDDGMAAQVDVSSIGDGPVLFIPEAQYFDDVRGRLGGRDRARGTLNLVRGRITTGSVSHAGPVLNGYDVVIGGDVWFYQQGFSVLAQAVYDKLSTVADAQTLAINAGKYSFSQSNRIDLNVTEGLVLNRRLAGTGINGGQGFGFNVGVETDLLGFPFTTSGAGAGVTTPGQIMRLPSTQPEKEEPRVTWVVSSAE